MTCRICFEPDPPLFHPCKCDGSIKWIHEECLFQWIRLRTDDSNHKCELCKEIYTISYNQQIEVDLVNYPSRTFFLINPSWHIASHILLVVLMNKAFPFMDVHLVYLVSYYLYHLTYFLFLGICIWKTIKQHTLYYQQLRKTSAITVLNFHIILFTVSLASYVDFHSKLLVPMVISSQCYLGIYPILHSDIIQSMNQTRRMKVINRY